MVNLPKTTWMVNYRGGIPTRPASEADVLNNYSDEEKNRIITITDYSQHILGPKYVSG